MEIIIQILTVYGCGLIGLYFLVLTQSTGISIGSENLLTESKVKTLTNLVLHKYGNSQIFQMLDLTCTTKWALSRLMNFPCHSAQVIKATSKQPAILFCNFFDSSLKGMCFCSELFYSLFSLHCHFPYIHISLGKIIKRETEWN